MERCFKQEAHRAHCKRSWRANEAIWLFAARVRVAAVFQQTEIVDGRNWHLADIPEHSTDVRFGSKADIHPPSANVRFTPKSGTCISSVVMSAMCQKQTYAVQQKVLY